MKQPQPAPSFPLPAYAVLRDWCIALKEVKAAQPWTAAQHGNFARRYAGLVGA
jgi:hypothetical protein